MNVRKIAAVARREYLETVKTKAFLIGVLVAPLLVIGLIALSTKAEIRAEQEAGTLELALIDRTGTVADEVLKLVKQRNDSGQGRRVNVRVVPATDDSGEEVARLRQQVKKGELFAAICVPPDLIENNAPCVIYAQGESFGGAMGTAQGLVREAVKRIRIARAGLDIGQVMVAERGVAFDHRDVAGKQKGPLDDLAGMMTPFAFVFLLFTGVFGVSQALLTSVVEEKTSRVMEVLLSALSPLELMTGKILGIALVGATLTVMWAVVGYGAAVWKDMEALIQITHFGQFLIYYVLGFLLYSSMLAAIGSACNTVKEAQSLTMPMTIVLIVPMVCWFYIVRHPESLTSTLLSFIPPITPMVMMLRVASPAVAGVPVWQQIVAPIWLAAWAAIAVWAAARVFRIGILLYGKPPGLRELGRWVRHG